jgi:hypothetical protein
MPDTEDSGRALFIVGECSSLSEAQWQQITESLPEPRCNAETLSKLTEIRGEVVEGLRASIQAERDQATRSEVAKKVEAVRASREFDDTDPNMLGLFEPNFSDRERRTPERTRKLAAKALDDLREGKGNKPFYPRSDGISAATMCALIVSIKLDWPGVRTKQAQAACQALYAAAGGAVKGTPNCTDGFWRDHLREAQKLGRDHRYSRRIEAALTP